MLVSLAVVVSSLFFGWLWSVLVVCVAALTWWFVLRPRWSGEPSAPRSSAVLRGLARWIGWILAAVGVAMTWLGGTGNYPGVDPAGASNSTTAMVVLVGVLLFLTGTGLVLASVLHRSRS